MTCIVKGSLVELINPDTLQIDMTPIETIKAGDIVRDPKGNLDVVERVYVQETGGVYNTYCVGGLEGTENSGSHVTENGSR